MMFNGAEQAVRFAYNMSLREIAARPNFTGEERSTSKEGLGPHDLHAQGALIQQAIGRLPDAERWAVQAIHAPDWIEPMACIAAYIHQRLKDGMLASREAVEDALLVWSHKSGSVRAFATKHGVSFRNAMRWKAEVSSKFSEVYLRAIELLEADLFREGGLELKNS